MAVGAVAGGDFLVSAGLRASTCFCTSDSPISAGGKNIEAPYPRMRKRIASRTYFNGQCPKVNGSEADDIRNLRGFKCR